MLHHNLKIPGIIFLLFVSRSALYVLKYFYATVSCRISISYVAIQKWIARETQLNIVMTFRYKERKAVPTTALQLSVEKNVKDDMLQQWFSTRRIQTKPYNSRCKLVGTFTLLMLIIPRKGLLSLGGS
jgi:hypothetical protein